MKYQIHNEWVEPDTVARLTLRDGDNGAAEVLVNGICVVSFCRKGIVSVHDNIGRVGVFAGIDGRLYTVPLRKILPKSIW